MFEVPLGDEDTNGLLSAELPVEETESASSFSLCCVDVDVLETSKWVLLLSILERLVPDISFAKRSMIETSLFSESVAGIIDPPLAKVGFVSSTVGDLMGSKYSVNVLSLANCTLLILFSSK